ncbi:hypothetical protein C8F01DRAFT_1266122 [Mycena amicta]|nr:hypothetical protein C8F01DRAFT_1266122 [Mycena amicta]
MDNEERNYLLRSQARIDEWERELAALTGKGDDLETEVAVGSDVDELAGDMSDDAVTRILLDPRPLRARRSLVNERECKRVWYTECKKMEGVLRRTHEAAKTAIQEKTKAEKDVKAEKKIVRALKREVDELKRELEEAREKAAARDTMGEEPSEALAALRVKYQKLKEDRKALRASIAEHDSEVNGLNDKIVNLREKYKAAKEECRTNSKELTVHEQKIGALIAQHEDAKNSLTARAVVKCRNALSQVSASKQLTLPQPYDLCRPTDNLFALLAQNPSTASFMNHILFLPQRVIPCVNNGFIAFGPRSRYDPVQKKWTPGSDLRLCKGRRELFVIVEGEKNRAFVAYAGTYLCHPLRESYPPRTKQPQSIPEFAIVDVAFGVPSKLSAENVRILINAKYPAGFIDVEAMGLELVDFNHALHDALGRLPGVMRAGQSKRAPIVAPAKRKGQEVGGAQGGPKKIKFSEA